MKIQYKGFMREKIQQSPVTISPDASFFEAINLIREKGTPLNLVSGLRAALKAAYLAGESPAPGIACLPG